MLLGRLRGRDEVVPLEGESVGEVRLGGGQADDGFGGGVAEGAGVEVDFEGAFFAGEGGLVKVGTGGEEKGVGGRWYH